jgi:hypothetical protein
MSNSPIRQQAASLATVGWVGGYFQDFRFIAHGTGHDKAGKPVVVRAAAGKRKALRCKKFPLQLGKSPRGGGLFFNGEDSRQVVGR